LFAFLIKLKNPNQQPFLLQQAQKAVELFWKMEGRTESCIAKRRTAGKYL
jgi:hypothetical protein